MGLCLWFLFATALPDSRTFVMFSYVSCLSVTFAYAVHSEAPAAVPKDLPVHTKVHPDIFVF